MVEGGREHTHADLARRRFRHGNVGAVREAVQPSVLRNRECAHVRVMFVEGRYYGLPVARYPLPVTALPAVTDHGLPTTDYR